MKPRALVMGLGRFGGGVGTARHLLANGYSVTVTDLASRAALENSLESMSAAERTSVTWHLGSHDEADFTHQDLIVVNPAVPPTSHFLEIARSKGVRLTSEVELFLEATKTRPILVTGTQGKSSTAHLIHGLLSQAGRRSRLAGNIGRSLLAELSTSTPKHELVVELSSYQLEALPKHIGQLAKASVCIITNLLTDHLARHGDLANYHAAKLRIVELIAPGGMLLLPRGVGINPELQTLLDRRGIRQAFCSLGESADYTIESGHFKGPMGRLAQLTSLRLPGAFQRSNALFALATVAERGVHVPDLDHALAQLTGLEHRNEELGHFGPHATRVIDNAVSTTPDSTQSAFESTAPAPVILLVGGRSKGMPLAQLAASCGGRLVELIAFGEAAEEFATAFTGTGPRTHTVASVETATAMGLRLARPGDTLLFSPAGSSFDAYSNFKQRATAFRAALLESASRRTPKIEL